MFVWPEEKSAAPQAFFFWAICSWQFGPAKICTHVERQLVLPSQEQFFYPVNPGIHAAKHVVATFDHRCCVQSIAMRGAGENQEANSLVAVLTKIGLRQYRRL